MPIAADSQDDAARWRGADLPPDAGLLHLEKDHAARLAAFARTWLASGRRYSEATLADLDCDGIWPVAKQALAQMRSGIGFAVLRGIDARTVTLEESEVIVWLLGLHLGVPVSQNAAGELVCHVVDKGVGKHELDRRGYAGRGAMDFHNDRTDIVGLFCYRKAKRGGESTLISALAMHEAIRRERPDIMPILRSGFEYDRRGEQGPGESPIGPRVPVFDVTGATVSCRFARAHIDAAYRRRGVPPPDEEKEALDAVDAVLARPDLRFTTTLQEGDIQFLNNYTVLHARNDYEDHDDVAEKRRMLRLWLVTEELRSFEQPQVMRFGRIYGNLGVSAAGVQVG